MKLLIFLLILFLAACNGQGAPLPTTSPTNSNQETPSPIPPTEPDMLTSVLPTQTLESRTAFPDPNDYGWQSLVTGLERPLDLQADGSGRLFVIEKEGYVRIIADGQLLEAPFLDITDRVRSDGNEQGLLGLAFHPQYQENGRFFVNYIDANGASVIARFEVSSDPNIADPDREVQLLVVAHTEFPHNGGVLAFGPDGFLYAGLGDGGSPSNGQKLDTFLGKILRLDVDSAEPYAVPADNPFGDEIWAYGLRNPWRLSFDLSTGDLYIADVGENQWEEIDFLPAGSPGGTNFGWNFREGAHERREGGPEGMIDPVAEYGHPEGGCSVTGGYVYRGAMPEWNGIYLYGDYCTGKIWGLIQNDGGWQTQLLFDVDVTITSFGQDAAGEVYLVSDGGGLYRLVRQ